MGRAKAKEFAGRIPTLEKCGILSEETYGQYFPPTSLSDFLRPKTVTLLRGDGDLCALGLYLAASSSQWHGRIYFFHGSPIPEFDHFPELLTQLQPQSLAKKVAQYGASLQHFPIELVPMITQQGFSWMIFSQQSGISFMPPNDSLIIFSGLLLSQTMNLMNGDINNILKKGCAIVLVDTEKNYQWKATVFDTIFTCTLKRKEHCSKRNLSVIVQDRHGKTYPAKHLISPTDRIFWLEKFTQYQALEQVITDCVRMKMTARDICQYLGQLNPPCRMTLATLARLKRMWGLRTNRPEKHPRAPRQYKKTQSAHNM